MDYEHVVGVSARVVELAGVAVLLLGALLPELRARTGGERALALAARAGRRSAPRRRELMFRFGLDLASGP